MSELTPITRKETFLAKAGGQNVVTPTPITREETFLQAIIDNGGGGGGTGGGVLVIKATMGSGTVTLDKTWNEISNAPYAVINLIQGTSTIILPIFALGEAPDGSEYSVRSGLPQANNGQYVFIESVFTTASADGYPVMNMG